MNGKESTIIKEFILESSEGLASISNELTQYEAEGFKDSELINSTYRTVHTLKGSACFLAFKKLETLAHSTETILDYLREKTLIPSSEMIDLLLASFDRCEEILKYVEENGTEAPEDNKELVDKLESLLEHELLKENNTQGEMVSDYPGEEIKKTNVSKNSDESRADDEGQGKPNISLVKPEEEKVKEVVEVETAKTEEEHVNQKQVADSTVRVSVNLLDKILNVVGELVLNRNQILQLSKEREEADLSRLSHQLNVITTELQTDIMTTRMQPVGTVFNKFERLVRDLARSQSKNIRLDIQGQETELDKTLLEYIKDPLTHLIRNAIDHGIETSEQRSEAGKPEVGNLSIKTYHAGGEVIIEIRDDGRGINTSKILDKAIQKGIMTQEEANSYPSHKAMNLIFYPGFSTAEQVTNISGRGVGMDVVKSNIEKIGGQCDVQSTLNEGTTFKLKIPLTLAIIPALIVMGGREPFAIPQKNLVELVLVDNDSSNKVEKLHDSEFFRLRGDLIPVFRLHKCLKLEKETSDDDSFNIIVLQSELGMYGLIVDEVLDTQEIVVKPLPQKLKTGGIYAGATIMGDGAVALILDAIGLFNKVANNISLEQEDFKADNLDYKLANEFDAEEILLFRLSDNREYGIPLCLVSRLEEFKTNKVEKSGKQSLIRYRNTAMPLIFLDEEVKYSKLQETKQMQKDSESVKSELPCIVSSIKGRSFGFIVDKILDIGKSDQTIDYTHQSIPGVMGTTFINEKIVTVIDIHKIIAENNLLSKEIDADKTFKAKILLVEDSVLYQRVIQETLENDGYQVVLAEDGAKGLELLKDHGNRFDLLVSDVEMPNLNGFDLVANLRKNDGPHKDIPVVLVTTRLEKEDLDKGKDVGVNAHLKKLDKIEVLNTVNQILS